eukprot:TRINITY_DN1206_c0_g2_i7.p1 TRINITY_DN1206_c0_g2~~TRINITY_DN1206_c0_g2_i7.p1  ORF type:complete len:264 (+),score=61.41 TRINITY_DN1206_c0_g2_i7:64-855(+)
MCIRDRSTWGSVFNMISIRKFVVSSLLRDRQCIVAVLAPVSKRGFAKKRRPEENVPYQISKFHRYLAQKREHELEERKTVKSESFDDLVEDAPEARVEGRGIVKASRLHLTPHQYWVTQGKGNERPFTGDYWFSKDLGHYECTVCETKLFSSDHKFFPPTGMASFWHHIENNVETVDDTGDSKEDNTNLVIGKYAKEEARPKEKQRAICRKCKSHLGLVYLDGPPPTFTRFSINSGEFTYNLEFFFFNIFLNSFAQVCCQRVV